MTGAGLELGLDLLGVVLVARPRASARAALIDSMVFSPPRVQRMAEATRDEVVAAVAVLDLDHVAGGAEAVDLLGQDELHVVSSSQRPVDV